MFVLQAEIARRDSVGDSIPKRISFLNHHRKFSLLLTASRYPLVYDLKRFSRQGMEKREVRLQKISLRRKMVFPQIIKEMRVLGIKPGGKDVRERYIFHFN